MRIYNFVIFFIAEEQLLKKEYISPDDVLRLNKATESKFLPTY